MKKHIKSVLSLVVIVAAMGLLLAVTNSITAPIIKANQNAAANEALLVVMPEGTGFEEVTLADYKLPATVTKAYKETSGLGYVFELNATGWKPNMLLMCGVTTDGTITGATCLSSSETWDYVNTMGPQMAGKTAETLVDVEAGVTSLSVKGYKAAMQDALNAATILGGGDVDVRTPEEKLQDSLKEALPAGDTFTKWFKTEDTAEVDTIYVADNGAGYVCVIGEEFIGVGADGVNGNQAASDAVKAMKDSTLTEIEIADSGIHPNITKAEKTASGNYLMEIKGAGYGIKGGDQYHPASGEYIMIRVCITPDGKILDCLTLSQKETEGFGDACAKEEFYGQFDGKTADTLTEIDAIAGATYTTNGYIEALQRCLDSVAILEGGAK